MLADNCYLYLCFDLRRRRRKKLVNQAFKFCTMTVNSHLFCRAKTFTFGFVVGGLGQKNSYWPFFFLITHSKRKLFIFNCFLLMCFLPLLVNSQKNLKVCKGKLRESGRKVADGSLKSIFEENGGEKITKHGCEKDFSFLASWGYIWLFCHAWIPHEASVGIQGVLLVFALVFCYRANWRKKFQAELLKVTWMERERLPNT